MSADDLYDACYHASREQDGLASLFFQEDLLALGVVDRVEDLMPAVHSLQVRSLLRLMKAEGRTCWSLRTREMAAKICQLNQDELFCYGQIEESGATGCWLRRIKERTHIPQQLIRKCIRILEQRRLIKGITSVKAPTQRIYMLFHYAPSDDVVGGSWYSDGDLDTGMIAEVGNLIIFHVRNLSWAGGRARVKRERHEDEPIVITDDATAATTETSPRRNLKRNSHTADIEDATQPRKQRSRKSYLETDTSHQLPYPHGNHDYPSTVSIHGWLTTSGAIDKLKSSSLTVAEIQAIVDVLVWDDKLEHIGDGYRTVYGVSERKALKFGNEEEERDGDIGTGLMKAPCGGCPVFDLCEEGGPVSAAKCTYFQRWLET